MDHHDRLAGMHGYIPLDVGEYILTHISDSLLQSRFHWGHFLPYGKIFHKNDYHMVAFYHSYDRMSLVWP